MADAVKVLSIDGGGIRGIIPALVLAELEKRLEAPIASAFDLIAGTSTGGIIALGLAKPGTDGKPEHSAADLAELYRSEGHRIFSRSVLHRVRAVGNALEEKFPASGVEGVLKQYLGETRLKDALTEVLVPAYEMEDRIPWFFSSRDAATKAHHDFPMWEVGRATSAAPTYFEPARIPSEDPDNKRGYWALVDGGVFANNPAMCALTEATSNYRADHGGEAPDVIVVSLGTGELTRTIHYDDAKGWGLLGWARPVLSTVLDGVSKTVDFQVRELCKVTEGQPERYYRLQVNLAAYGSDEMDDATGTNLLALEQHAKNLIEAETAKLDQICAVLA